MKTFDLLSILISSLAAGMAACAVVWIVGDMFWGYKFATRWSKFFLIGVLVSLPFLPVYYTKRKRLTTCSKCRAAWSKRRSRREHVRTITKPGETEWHMKEYWQYWTCESCGEETRHLEREGNTQKGD